MKYLLVITFLVSTCLSNLTLASIEYDKFPQNPAILAPDFTLPSTSEHEIKLSDYKGKLILLNFWATFCAPCRMEMPSLQALSEEYQHEEVEIIAVSLDQGRKVAIKKWIKKMGLEFAIALEGEPAGEQYEVSALPVTFIIGKQGQLIGRIVGEREWNNAETRNFIEQLLADEALLADR
jgi:peroxiredoxin